MFGNKVKYIPAEIVDIIASFHDYEKHHKKILASVLEDIVSIGEIFVDNVPPSIAYKCWGNGNIMSNDSNADLFSIMLNNSMLE